MRKKVKNIIFDLGGVLLSVDFSKTQRAFENLGVTNFNDFFNHHHSSSLFKELEIGAISPEEFYENFRKTANINLTDNQIKNAWNALVGDFSMENIKWLEEVGNKYNIFLFSNTNQIHYDAFQSNFQQVTGKTNFDDYFIHAFYSHEINARKPDVAAFEKVMELAKINPAETLFVDDTIGNIEAAKKVGFLTELITGSKTIFDLNL